MFVIGLTGGIASGKSLISTYLNELGAYIIDADLVARDVVDIGTEGLRGVIQYFGSDYLMEDGRLNRKKLGCTVFADPEKLKKLNEILHPLIEEIIKERLSSLSNERKLSVVVLDAPLLIENGLQHIVDEVWLVTVGEKEQIKRLKERNGYTEKEAKVRIHKQMPQNEKIKYADKIIDNSGDIASTLRQVKNLWLQIRHNMEG